MAGGGEGARCLHAGGSPADAHPRKRPMPGRPDRPRQLELVAGARVDHARHAAIEDRAVDAGLVTGDADVRGSRGRIPRLLHDLRVGQKRPGHRHEVGVPRREHVFGERHRVDPVGSDDRHADCFPDRPRPWTPGAMGHQRLHGGDPSLVPAHADVDGVDLAIRGETPAPGPERRPGCRRLRRSASDIRKTTACPGPAAARTPPCAQARTASAAWSRRPTRRRAGSSPAPRNWSTRYPDPPVDLHAVEPELAGLRGPDAPNVLDRFEHLLARTAPRGSQRLARIHRRRRHRRQPERQPRTRSPPGMEQLEKHAPTGSGTAAATPAACPHRRPSFDASCSSALPGADPTDRRPAGHVAPHHPRPSP